MISALLLCLGEVPDTCEKKLAMIDVYGFGPTLLSVPAARTAGRITGPSCYGGRCCAKMPNPTQIRCDLAMRRTKNRLHLCYWDAESASCRGTSVPFDPDRRDGACARALSLLKPSAREPFLSWPFWN